MCCQRRLIPDDPDLVVVDFNFRDDGLQERLPGLGIAGIKLFSYELREGFQAIGGYHRPRVGLDCDPIDGSLREFALRLECVDPFLQLGVKVDYSTLDRVIEPA